MNLLQGSSASDPYPSHPPNPTTAPRGPPELVVSVLQVLVDPAEVGTLPLEGLAGSGVLQHLGDAAQAAALLGMQRCPSCHIHHGKAIRGHHCRVHEAVVEQVAHDLKA